MKIGIMTFHRAINTGAVLQAHALQDYLISIGTDAELIDFYPNNQIPNRSKIYRCLRKMKRVFSLNKNYRLERNKEDKFDFFMEKYYKLSSKQYFGDETLKRNPPKYDVLISGSDQVLNTSLTGESSSYYLDFDNTVKKISYASSFGRTDLSETEKRLIKDELPKFYSLSFREQSGRKLVENLTGIIGKDVLDPVFLMDRTYWSELCAKKLRVPDRYIFVYAMEVTSIFKKVVTMAAENYNLPVVIVNASGSDSELPGKADNACGPMEFLRYVRDAEIVITNSFHGTAFSLIFEKKLLSIAHSRKNIRLENLLEYIDCLEYQIDSDIKVDNLDTQLIDLSGSICKLERYIEASRYYLKNALLGKA